MSAPELPAAPAQDGDAPEVETARPSVVITRNARGAVQMTVKVYGVDSTEKAAYAAAEVAQQIYDGLTAKYGGAPAKYGGAA